MQTKESFYKPLEIKFMAETAGLKEDYGVDQGGSFEVIKLKV